MAVTSVTDTLREESNPQRGQQNVFVKHKRSWRLQSLQLIIPMIGKASGSSQEHTHITMKALSHEDKCSNFQWVGHRSMSQGHHMWHPKEYTLRIKALSHIKLKNICKVTYFCKIQMDIQNLFLWWGCLKNSRTYILYIKHSDLEPFLKLKPRQLHGSHWDTWWAVFWLGHKSVLQSVEGSPDDVDKKPQYWFSQSAKQIYFWKPQSFWHRLETIVQVYMKQI